MASFVSFVDAGTSESGKTKIWAVKGSGGAADHIGEVRWSAPWQQYIFEPAPSVYNSACLQEIAEFLERSTLAHYRERERK